VQFFVFIQPVSQVDMKLGHNSVAAVFSISSAVWVFLFLFHDILTDLTHFIVCTMLALV